MQVQEKAGLRALRTGALVTFAVTLTLYSFSFHAVAWGFLVGAILSLFSLFSLTVIVPFLFQPGAPGTMKALLSLTLFMKMPIYIIGLLFLMHATSAVALVALLGIALGPAIITLQAIDGMVMRHVAAPAPARARRRRMAETQPARAAHPCPTTELVTERG